MGETTRPTTVVFMSPDSILEVLMDCATAVGEVFGAHQGRGYSGHRATQYHLDVAADEAAVSVLHRAGFRVVSEESGETGAGDLTVVVDPIDGSTNCDRGIPYFATSLAVLEGETLVAGLVKNQADGTTYYATVGGGAYRDGERISPSRQSTVAGALVSFSGLPERHVGWGQIRALGAASLEGCFVADGRLDLYTVAQRSSLSTWDYLAAMLIATEAGATVLSYGDHNLVGADREPRFPLFAATAELAREFLTHGRL